MAAPVRGREEVVTGSGFRKSVMVPSPDFHVFLLGTGMVQDPPV